MTLILCAFVLVTVTSLAQWFSAPGSGSTLSGKLVKNKQTNKQATKNPSLLEKHRKV